MSYALIVWCGRRDLNPHAIKTAGFEPDAYTIPPRPQFWWREEEFAPPQPNTTDLQSAGLTHAQPLRNLVRPGGLEPPRTSHSALNTARLPISPRSHMSEPYIRNAYGPDEIGTGRGFRTPVFESTARRSNRLSYPSRYSRSASRLRVPEQPGKWCDRWDSNPHEKSRRPLKTVRIPFRHDHISGQGGGI